MSLAVAIQMDPVETINIDSDSTFVLALEALKRGFRLHHYLPQHLSLRDGRLTAQARSLEVRARAGPPPQLRPVPDHGSSGVRRDPDAPGSAV